MCTFLSQLTAEHKHSNHQKKNSIQWYFLILPFIFHLNRDDPHDDDIIFEDFARLRLKGGETEA